MRKRLIETVPLSGLEKAAKLDGQDVKQLREVARLMLGVLETLRTHYSCFYGPLWDEVEAAIQKAKDIL